MLANGRVKRLFSPGDLLVGEYSISPSAVFSRPVR